jgi:hypothetical protein
VYLFVDADACPVKDEVYVVATRYGVPVVLVANQRMHVPPGFGAELVLVDGAPDSADDWIVQHIEPGDLVVTADIPLAARCLAAGARVLGTSGHPFTEESIGVAVAGRELASHLRELGVGGGGPPALSTKDRARFASRLDEMVQRALREEGA